MQSRPTSKLFSYAIALAAVGIATLIRYVLDPWLGAQYYLVLLFGAVGVAVWVGGYGPGTIASILGYVLTYFFFISPSGELSGISDAFGLASYLVACAIVIAMGEALRRARGNAVSALQRLARALKASRTVAWEYDVKQKKLTASDNIREFLNLSREAGGLENVTRHIHPEDKRRHDREIAEAIRHGTDYFASYRFVRPADGKTMWIEDHGEVARNARGDAVTIRGVAIDASERVRLEERLSAQSKALAAANERKSRFIATLAHELRSPLATIKSAASVLQSPRSEPNSRARAAQIVSRQADSIEHLVADLMDATRIEQGKMKLDLRRVDLGKVMQNAIEGSIAHIEAKNQRLVVELPEQPLIMDLDEYRFSQVINNLLHNSSTYTPEGGLIRIRGCREQDRAVVSVSDNGIGIAPERLESIFGMFMQLDGASGSGRNHGLGIGLSLVKAIVELHGGSVKAQSEGPGKGAAFRISLPLKSASG